METKGIKEKFASLYGGDPLLVRSPGRVNIIGEHTDYNEGFVLPAAIDKEVVCAVKKNGTSALKFYAIDLSDSYEIELKDIAPCDKGWPNYLMGVIAQMQKAGHVLSGVDVVFGSDVPIGAGLSSSAAIECCFAYALNELYGLGIEKMDLVKMAQKAEHEYAGVQCGIMDQFASMFGKKDSVIKLDCRSLEYEHFSFDLSGYKIVLVDTQVKHSLASSEYNTRRKECESGVEILKKYKPEINSLRDVEPELLEAHKDEMNDVVYRRCSYVISENIRLQATCEAFEKNQFEEVGQLLYQGHAGLRDNYEVSCKELDYLVEVAKETDGVLGARMMGGGFGGCTINLVKEDAVDAFAEKASKLYKEKFDKDPRVFIASIEDGTSVVN